MDGLPIPYFLMMEFTAKICFVTRNKAFVLFLQGVEIGVDSQKSLLQVSPCAAKILNALH